MKWWELHKDLESPYFKRSKWQNLRQPFGKSPITQAASSLHPKCALLRKAYSDGQGQNKTSSLKFWLSMQFWNHIWKSLSPGSEDLSSLLRNEVFWKASNITLQATSKFLFQMKNLPQADNLSRHLHTRPKHIAWSLLQSSDSPKHPLAFLAKSFPWHQL